MGSLVSAESFDTFYRDANLPAVTSFTMAGWFKPTSAVADYRSPLIIQPAASTPRIHLQWSSSFGLSLAVHNGTTDTRYDDAYSFVTDDWYYCALTCSGTGATDLVGYLWDDTGTLVANVSGQVHSFTPAYFMFAGTDWISNRHLAGRFGYGRVWDVALSQGELEAEQFSPTPVKTTSFNSGFVDSTTGIDPQSSRGWTNSGMGTDSDTPPVSSGTIIPLISATYRMRRS